VHIVNRLVCLFARGVHRLYKLTLSPLLGNSCRFHPTCSDYALESLERHGLVRGGWLSFKRVVKCHPWCDGGFDYVPEVKK
jgi:hypothetical protein